MSSFVACPVRKLSGIWLGGARTRLPKLSRATAFGTALTDCPG